ncbi:hypothetical protein [Bacillus manliponensis]|uniref:Group-specific protein n=1 Tax=Bacillus manliponensis TaxID=574376 RepID=A0A073JX92_9BACI|nr:hypothetical protein [Bacillus manliponensis]KEK19629.1 hypothetical protein BAMA_20385 [Bacillus manliponensis]
MKSFSIWSLRCIALGTLLFGVNWIIEGYVEPIVFIGIICLVAGSILSFIAIAKQEEGRLKFVSPLFFFLALFFITWYEPFQIIRIVTWLKNLG